MRSSSLGLVKVVEKDIGEASICQWQRRPRIGIFGQRLQAVVKDRAAAIDQKLVLLYGRS